MKAKYVDIILDVLDFYFIFIAITFNVLLILFMIKLYANIDIFKLNNHKICKLYQRYICTEYL